MTISRTSKTEFYNLMMQRVKFVKGICSINMNLN